MFRLPSIPWPRALAGRLALAVLTGLAGVGVRPSGVEAAPSVASTPSHGADDPGHRCKCGMNCRGPSCCCSRAKAPASRTDAPIAPRAKSTDRPGAATTTATPCVQAAPCDGAGLPSDSTGGPVGRAILPTGADAILTAPARGWLITAGAATAPMTRADRLDDPPEA